MKIKEVRAGIILDSRGEKSIEVIVNAFATSAPYGKSIGKHEKKAYVKNAESDTKFINSLKSNKNENLFEKLPEIYYMGDLEKIEELFKRKIGANTLFALEASIMKALAFEKKKELWQILNPKLEKNRKDIKFPRLISNTIGGGAHCSKCRIKPDFQEFLVMVNKNPSIASRINRKFYESIGEVLNKLRINILKKNDENAWQTDLDNEGVLDIMTHVKKKISEDSGIDVEIGIDAAASQFFKNKKYRYKNKIKTLTKEKQIDYISELVKKYELFYVEDALDEEDFSGFSELCKKTNALIVGDDLTVTNVERVKEAIKMKAVTGIIIKPNQTGSLLEVKKIFEICNKECIKTIVSHRSGETLDSTIADIAFAFQADFIKIPVVGEERESKVNRLIELENAMKGVNLRYKQ